MFIRLKKILYVCIAFIVDIDAGTFAHQPTSACRFNLLEKYWKIQNYPIGYHKWEIRRCPSMSLICNDDGVSIAHRAHQTHRYCWLKDYIVTNNNNNKYIRIIVTYHLHIF